MFQENPLKLFATLGGFDLLFRNSTVTELKMMKKQTEKPEPL